MNKKGIKRIIAAGLCFLVTIMLTATAFAQEAEPGGVVVQESAGNDTQVWAGVSVDYMFPLRYEVHDPNSQPLADVSIEHYDYAAQEYVYVGRTNAQGVWETRVPAGYFNQVIIGGAQGVSVADTRALYEGNNELKHRLSKDGFVIVQGLADYTVETTQTGEPVVVIRITMEYDTPESGSTPDGGSSQPAVPDSKPSSKPTVPGGTLPQTGVPAYWVFFGIGSLLLLFAALIVYKILRDEKTHRKKQEVGGMSE